MRLLLLIPFLVAGCTVVPVKRNFPEVPQEITVACPELKEVQPTDKLSDVLKVVTENYGQYHECRAKVDAWNEWYQTQKDIFNSVK